MCPSLHEASPWLLEVVCYVRRTSLLKVQRRLPMPKPSSAACQLGCVASQIQVLHMRKMEGFLYAANVVLRLGHGRGLACSAHARRGFVRLSKSPRARWISASEGKRVA